MVNYFATETNRQLELGKQPNLSHDLESIRAYQWELEIDTGVPGDVSKLTLAAKTVSPIGINIDPIVARRVNDPFKYPGQVTFDEINIVFDNLVRGQVAEQLFDWFSSVYDPVTGVYTPTFLRGQGEFKRNIKLYQLDNAGLAMKHIHLYAAFPKMWKAGEFNYETNAFHNIEVTLEADFVTQEAGL